MAEDAASLSQSVLSSVLGFVSREIQEFVVTAVTGNATTSSSTTPAGLSVTHSAKHKRSRSAKSFREDSPVRNKTNKRRRRPSSPPPHVPLLSKAGQDQDEYYSDRDAPSARRSKITSEQTFRKPDTPKASKSWDLSFLTGPDSFPSPKPHPTMPGSLFTRSPTPAEFRSRPRRSSLSQRRSLQIATPESVLKRGQGRRSLSRVRFDPQVIRHTPRPRSSSPSEEEKEGDTEEEEPSPDPSPEQSTPGASSSKSPDASSAPVLEPGSPKIKVEDDDEIVEIPSLPPPPSPSKTRGRPTTTKKRLESDVGGQRAPHSPVPVLASPASRSPPQVPKDTEVTQNDPKGKGKAKEVQVDEQDDTEERETADQEDPGRERIKQLEEEVQRLKEQLAKSGPGRDSPLPPPPAPPAPPLPPPGYIAIPATSWANGPRHPSQRTPIIKPKVNKTLKPSVPLESMDAFLSELRTAKLRNTRPDQNMSPLTLRKSTHSVQETANTSTVSTGLQSLRASLRRKRPLEAEDETSMPPRVRWRSGQSPEEGDGSFTSISSGAQSNLSDSQGRVSQWGSQSISWSYPGPTRLQRPSQRVLPPMDQAGPSQPGRPGYLAGLAPSDLTTPSLCSDTEADGEPEQTNNSREQEALTPPDEDDVVEVDRIDVPQEHHQRIPSMRARNSDLQLDDLQPLGRRLNLVPAVKQAPNPLPQQRPSGQADKTKSSHTGPVPGTPNVFSARPPKSPLPHQKVAQKPKPPARAATSSHNGVPHAQSPSPSPQTTRRFVHPPELSDDEDAGESTTPLQLPTKEVSAGRARQSHLQPRVSQADLITFTPSHNGPSSSKQVPRDDAREEEQSLARSLYQARKARRRFAESFSLDEELRRVAVNDRIAELELGELGDTTMGGGTQGDVELEQDVLVGFGTKPKNSTFTSGGGGGGVPVAVDNGNSSFRSEASDSSFRMKSRIPVPKGLNRSR